MKKNILVVSVFFFITTLCACGEKVLPDAGPTNDEVRDIFTSYFVNKSIPLAWAGSMLGGKLKEINITNVKRGDSIKKMNGGTLPPPYNSSSQDCWPVSMHVKGESMALQLLNRRTSHTFEEDASFKLCKSYEGGWIIDAGKIMMMPNK